MIEIILGIGKSIIAHILIMIICTNVIGFIVRGLCAGEIPFISIIVGIVFLYALGHFGNILLVIVGIVQMLTRLPDLLWEINNGKRPTIDTLPKGHIYSLANIISILCLPLTYIALCWWD